MGGTASKKGKDQAQGKEGKKWAYLIVAPKRKPTHEILGKKSHNKNRNFDSTDIATIRTYNAVHLSLVSAKRARITCRELTHQCRSYISQISLTGMSTSHVRQRIDLTGIEMS